MLGAGRGRAGVRRSRAVRARRRGTDPVAGRDLPIPDTLAGLVDSPGLADLPAGPRGPAPGACRGAARGAAGPEYHTVRPGCPARTGLTRSPPGLLEEAEGRRCSPIRCWPRRWPGRSPARRRALHAAAAASSTGLEERARHRALAAAGPDAATADELAGAGRRPRPAVAPATAAELLELSAGLTPAGQPGRIRGRLLAAAGHLVQAGETRAAAAVLSGLASTAEPGPDRAAALSELAWNLEDDLGESLRLLDLALAEAGPDPLLRARISFYRSDFLAMRGDMAAATVAVGQAAAAAEQSGDQALLAASLAQTYLYSVMSGAEADGTQLDRALAIERSGPALVMLTPPSEVAGTLLDADRAAGRRRAGPAARTGPGSGRGHRILASRHPAAAVAAGRPAR